MKREISAGIIVFRKTKEGTKFLILYHGHRYWNFPKGHIENEEQSLETAYRETTEETGLVPSDLRLMRNFKTHERFTFRRKGESVYKIVIFYLAQTNNPRIIVSPEHQGYGWFLFEDAKHILGKYRDSQRVLQQAHDYLVRRSKNRPTAANPVSLPDDQQTAISPSTTQISALVPRSTEHQQKKQHHHFHDKKKIFINTRNHPSSRRYSSLKPFPQKGSEGSFKDQTRHNP